VHVFKQLLPAVCASLDDIESWPGEAIGKALLFSASFNDAFVVALEVLVSVLQVTKPLYVRLQGAPQAGLSPGFTSRGAKNQKGGHIFKIQYWMYVATGGPNVKWEGADFK